MMFKRSGDATDESGYGVFTNLFDEVVDAGELDRRLPPMAPEDAAAYRRACEVFQRGLADWKLGAQLSALDATARIRRSCTAEQLRSTVVSLLIDHSGSMRGQKILLAAAATEVATDFLLELGVKIEILGFTTVGWRGGQSRRAWIAAGRPAKPGRLCDLRYIVYGAAADRRWGGLWPMLRPDLLHENVDGEAIEWAASRLRARPEPRKLLIVISDGAPADDSTLTENGPNYLVAHLRQVVAGLRDAGDIELSAIGIGYRFASAYERTAAIESPDDLGGALLRLLESSLVTKPPSGGS
ncbi:hypothetical protein KXS07_04080 [Inquilinus limosus]|uniref:cobaltochelatase CobT-related protein n=1 Tax=Inquilinus limosus TaxID=171674 RepID=UPI003F173B96